MIRAAETTIERVARVRDWLIAYHEFFGVLSTRLQIVETHAVETAATDGRKLFVNPAYIAGLSDRKLAGLIAHEVLHCSNRHFDRIGDREHNAANEAADYSINWIILQAGLELPDGVLIDPQFNGLAFEEIYAIRQQARKQEKPQPQPQPQNGQGQGQEGDSGNGQPQPQPGQPDQSGKPQPGSNAQPGQDGKPQPGQPGAAGQPQPGTGQDIGQPGQPGTGQPGNGQAMPDPGKCGAFFAPDPEDSANDESSLADQWEQATRQAAAIAARDNGGDMPGFVRSVIDGLDAARIDWRARLAAFLTDRAAQDYSFKRPNRRTLNSGFYLPSLQPDGIDSLIWFVDSSGSMNKPAYHAMGGELQTMLDSGWIRRIHVIQCDTDIRHESTYESGDTISLQVYGGGGTDFRKAMPHIAENYSDSVCMIGFTDMEISREKLGIDPGLPVIWAIWGRSSQFAEKSAIPEFGECFPMAAD